MISGRKYKESFAYSRLLKPYTALPASRLVSILRERICVNCKQRRASKFFQIAGLFHSSGIYVLFELNDPVKGSYYYEIASKNSQAPPYIKRVAAKILNEKWKDKDKAQVLLLLLKTRKIQNFEAISKANSKTIIKRT